MSSSNDALPTPASNSNTRAEPRRRSAVATAKTNANGEISTEVNDAMVATNGKDLGHKTNVRGESAVERPKEVADLRKGLAAPAPVAYHRKRKQTSRSETPRWQTMLSVVTKLCLLIVGLIWLGQMISKLSNGNTVNYPFAAMESDGRISEVESFVKKTAKMLQVQLEVVDKKIGSEIGAVSKELAKKIEEKSAIWAQELKKLEERSEDLGKSMGELKDMGLLTREEFESFKNELAKRKSSRESSDVSLDEIGALAKEIVEKEIEKHAADGLGRVDYALASGGARVITHSEPFVSGKASNWFAVGKDRSRVHSNAKKMLEPSFGEPGQCFALQGSSGYVDIRLRSGITPEAVTLEHVAKSVAYDRSSAPKDCVVSAWFEGSGEPGHPKVLTTFSYDLEKSNAQTFNVEATDKAVVNMVRLEFTSNHGHPSLTCIYRFRVHGYESSTPQSEDSRSLPEAENAGPR